MVTVHKCSKCGATNLKRQFLISEAAYNDRGLPSKKTLARRENAAREDLANSTKEMLDEAYHIDADTDFYRLDLDGKCDKCGNIEPWGRMKLKSLELVTTIVGVICVFDFLFMLLVLMESSSGLEDVPYPMYIVLGAGALVFGVKYLWIMIQKLKLRNYPSESLPKVIKGN